MQSAKAGSTVASPVCLTSLVDLETNGKPLRWGETSSQRKLHAKWASQRRSIIDAMMYGDGAMVKRAQRIEGCCSHPLLTTRTTGECGMVLYCCRDRMCPRCQAGRSLQNAKKLGAVITSMNAPRQVELTIRHKQASLSSEIDRLWTAFRALKKTPLWKKVCKGGVGVLEVTVNEKDRTWHPHLHLVVDGEYCPQKLLADEWERITGDSKVVYIQAVHDRSRTAKYISKYLAKSSDPCSMSGPEIREFASAMHGRRLVFTFGSFHRVPVDPRPAAQSHKDDVPLISAHRLTAAAIAGFAGAQRAVDLIAAANRTWAQALGCLPFGWDVAPVPLTSESNAFIVSVCKAIIEAASAVEPEAQPQICAKYKGGGEHQVPMFERSGGRVT